MSVGRVEEGWEGGKGYFDRWDPPLTLTLTLTPTLIGKVTLIAGTGQVDEVLGQCPIRLGLDGMARVPDELVDGLAHTPTRGSTTPWMQSQ